MNLTTNKWANAAITFALVTVAVVVAISLVTFKPNATGELKATLNLKKKA